MPKSEFHHIGVTAIPGSLTKGDVDVLLRVEARDFMPSVATLRQHFTINQRKIWSDVFASFADDCSFPFPPGIQLVVKGSEADFFLFLSRASAALHRSGRCRGRVRSLHG